MAREWWQFMGQPWGPSGFAFGVGSRFFEFGEVRLAILSLLAEGPKHGYQLMKEMKERSGGMYRASAGSVYPTLQQLEDEGLIESEQKDGRRVYRLTVAGRAELEKDPEAVRRIWERAERWDDWGQYMRPETMAFLGPLGEVLKSTMRAAKRAAGNAEREDRLRTIIRRFCKELDELSGR
jgi:DNA-binding PadR family transcriptional regulator